MGNVSGREDGVGSSSGVDGEAGDQRGSGGGNVYDEADISVYLARPSPLPEAMGQSPPHSPRATQSPLMFTPQVSLSIYCSSQGFLHFWILNDLSCGKKLIFLMMVM